MSLYSFTLVCIIGREIICPVVPIFSQGYFRKGEALEQAFCTDRVQVPGFDLADIVRAYCSGNKLEPNVGYFTNAVFIAIDIGKCNGTDIKGQLTSM